MSRAGDDARRRHQREIRELEKKHLAWLINEGVGAVVDYHGVITNPLPTQRGMITSGAPFLANDGTWVVFLEGKAGYVAVAAVRPHAPETASEARR